MAEEKIRTTTYEINDTVYIVEAVESETAKESVSAKIKRMILNTDIKSFKNENNETNKKSC